MKGIILAGGSGTRLDPLTKVACKQLLPVYNKPMIFYPLSILMLAGIQEILLITTPADVEAFRRLLGDGAAWNLKIQYEVQEKPRGISDAFLIGEKFIGNDSCALILGDNLFYKDGLQQMLADARSTVETEGGAVIFAYHVSDPERYGVADLEIVDTAKYDRVVSIEEKPENPKSNYAVVGLYFYDSNVVQAAKGLSPSGRGELEITDINKKYLSNKSLRCIRLGRGAAWLDMGTPDSLLDAGQFVATIERRQGLRIADLNEISEHMGFVL